MTCLKHQVFTGDLFTGKPYDTSMQCCGLTTITYELAEGCLMNPSSSNLDFSVVQRQKDIYKLFSSELLDDEGSQ